MRQLLTRSVSSFHPHLTAGAYASTRTSLAALSAQLAHLHTREEVLPAVLKAALRFLHADLSALSLYDRRTQQHHTAAVASTDGHWSPLRSFLSKVPAGLTCESDGESGDVLVLPDDDPRHPFASVLENATSTAAYVALRDEDAMLGTLHVVRPAYLRFSQDDRLLVRGIGDHAMLALATVVVA